MVTKPKAAKKETTAVAHAKVQLPANAQEQMQKDVAALANKLAAPSGKSILITQSKEFKFPDGDRVDSFKGVIVAFVGLNAYYEGAFDRDNLVPPNCFAIGPVKNDDLVASENSPEPQNADDGGACKTCWANQWKSSATGNGKACKNSIKIAVLCEDGEVRPMGLSATALKAFGEYVRQVVQSFGVAPYGVMTEFTFSSSEDYPSVRCGSPVKLNDEQLALAFSLKDSATEMLSVEPDVSEFEEKVVAARAKPAKATKAAPKKRAA